MGRFEIGLAEMAIRENMALHSYSPLAFGLLTGKYQKSWISIKIESISLTRLSRYNGERSKIATAAYLNWKKTNWV